MSEAEALVRIVEQLDVISDGIALCLIGIVLNAVVGLFR